VSTGPEIDRPQDRPATAPDARQCEAIRCWIADLEAMPGVAEVTGWRPIGPEGFPEETGRPEGVYVEIRFRRGGEDPNLWHLLQVGPIAPGGVDGGEDVGDRPTPHPDRGAGSARRHPTKRGAPAAITIDTEQRDALRGLPRRLGGTEDAATAPACDDCQGEVGLLRGSAAALRLLVDLGGDEGDERTAFEPTMPAEELRSLLTRLRRMSIEAVEAYLARPEEYEETAIGDLSAAVVCGGLLNALSATEKEDPR